MAVKFSQFDGTISPSKTSQTQYIVGFEGQDNAKWTMKQLADEMLHQVVLQQLLMQEEAEVIYTLLMELSQVTEQ